MKLYSTMEASKILGINPDVLQFYARTKKIKAKKNKYLHYVYLIRDIYQRQIQVEKPQLTIIESVNENDRYFIIADTVRFGNVQLDFRVVEGYVYEDFKSIHIRKSLKLKGFKLL